MLMVPLTSLQFGQEVRGECALKGQAVHARPQQHDSQQRKVEATQVTTDGWMNKQNMIYAHSEIRLSLKKQENCHTCYDTDEPLGHYATWNKPITKGQLLYDSTYLPYLERSNSHRWKECCWPVVRRVWSFSFAKWKEFCGWWREQNVAGHNVSSYTFKNN